MNLLIEFLSVLYTEYCDNIAIMNPFDHDNGVVKI